MKLTSIKASLQELRRGLQAVLEDTIAIDWAIADLEASKNKFDQLTRRTDNPHLSPQPWGYRIHPEQPLRFRSSSPTKGFEIWADLYCTVLWEKEEAVPAQQEIHLRVWSKEGKYVHREEWDSEGVLARLTDPNRQYEGRVILRCHFDRANPDQHGPRYHVQFGGEARDYELCWIPGIANLPRLIYPPMDLILTCQLVLANFHRDYYEKLRDEPTWVDIIRRSQKHLLTEYYQDCINAVAQEKVLLDYLWNV